MPTITACRSGLPKWITRLHRFIWSAYGWAATSCFTFGGGTAPILAKYVQEILLDPRTLARPYLERKAVEAIVRGHLKGNRNYTTEIHRLLSLELLHRLFVDKGAQHETAGTSLA